MMTTENKKNFLINIAFALTFVAGGYLILKFAAVYLFPFFIGILLAAITQKPSKFLEQKFKIKRGILAAIMVLLIFLLLILIIALIAVKAYGFLIENFKGFKDALPHITASFSQLSGKISNFFDGFQNDMFSAERIAEFINVFVENAFAQITDLISGFATRVASRLPSLIFTVTVTVAASCYIAKDYEKMKNYVKNIIPEKFTNKYLEIRDVAFEGIFKMMKGYFFMFLLVFSLLAVGFLILGRGNWLILAIITATVDVLPVLGTGTVLLPWAVLEFFFGNFFLGTGLIVLYVAITVFRHIFEPKIIGKQTGLHPLICLVVMFVGIKSAGLLGLVLFPLTTVILTNLLKSGKIKI